MNVLISMIDILNCTIYILLQCAENTTFERYHIQHLNNAVRVTKIIMLRLGVREIVAEAIQTVPFMRHKYTLMVNTLHVATIQKIASINPLNNVRKLGHLKELGDERKQSTAMQSLALGSLKSAKQKKI